MFDVYSKILSVEMVQTVLRILYYTSYVWLPAFLFFTLWNLWITYKRAQFLAKQENIFLEIKIPKDVFKSPKAMEFFMNSLYQTFGEANWYEKYWKGSLRAHFSLEIVSIGGGIHFFIMTRKGYKNMIESNLYSQYPGIEIYEVPDYTLPISYDPEKIGMWAAELGLTKADAYPIKTYLDYGMDKDPKEEYKIDPLTPLLEFMGSLKQGHQAWFQIIVRAHKAEDKDPKTGEKIDAKWKKAAEEEIKKIQDKGKGEMDKETKKPIPGTSRFLSDGETETIKALERSISKVGFDVGMRVIYVAEKELFDMSNVGGIMGGITQFNSSLNGFKVSNGVPPKYKWFPWKDRSKKTIDFEKGILLDAYKARGFFYNEFKRPYFVLNTEELATVFHFPGNVAQTPTLSRISSKKSEAPSNLPL